MDNTTTSPPLQAQTPVPTQANDLSGELAHVTKEMYKKNLELADKNKTLSLLRKIDEIVLGSVTDTREIAQQVVNSVVTEAGFKAAVIMLLDKKNACLTRLAISQTEPIVRAELEYNRTYLGDKILLSSQTNLMVKAVLERKMQTTQNLYDVLNPSFSQEEAKKIQEILGITMTVINPLIVRNDVIGVIGIDVGERDALLSEYQQDLINRLAGVVGIAIDNALLYQNIQMANDRLKELDKMKDEFVSLASHELRTPMTAIKSYIWMLLENKMIQDEKGKDYLQNAYTSTDRLINLVNDMLNVSRIESGRMIINLAPVDLVKLIQEVISEILPAAQKQHLNLIFNPPSTFPQVLADANKIKEVIINLVGNSIKFTPENGSIILNLSEENGMVVVKVTDTGKGLLPEDMAKLFQKFGMLEKNYLHKKATTGTGLGLYICKSIVERHGGRIWVESKGEDQGATFTFTLKPTTAATTTAQAQTTQPAAPTPEQPSQPQPLEKQSGQTPPQNVS